MCSVIPYYSGCNLRSTVTRVANGVEYVMGKGQLDN